jgi:hypothetical protein
MIRKPASDIDAAANEERLPGAGFCLVCLVIAGLSNPMDSRAAGQEPDRKNPKGTPGFIVLAWGSPGDPADPDIMALSV